MHSTFKNIRLFISLLPFILLFYSCSDNEDLSDEINLNETGTLINSNLKASLTTQELRLITEFAGFGNITPKIEFDIESYVLTYTTKDIDDNIITVSGVVSIPKTDNQLSSILLSRGTTLANTNSPSINSLPTYELGAALGYVIMTPDLIGFGESNALPQNYFIKNITAYSSIDFLKATKEFLNQKGVSISNDLILAGYSQGGASTFSIMEYFDDYNKTDYQVSKVYAGAGGYFLEEVMNTILSNDTYDAPSFLALIIYSFNENYRIEDGYEYYFNAPYNDRIASILDGSLNISQVNSQLSDNIEELFTSEFLSSVKTGNDEINTYLNSNSISVKRYNYPIHLYHSTEDEILPISTSDSLYQSLILENNEVEYTKVTGNHSDASIDILIKIFDDLK
ncbi:hypothetical protein KMW28_10725 [Flammeovirga yaeyamensis]|uniref:Lipoprotein n=1 Tax=Flammeovirga yaeyamensis TaxID=367791 RepID=A0AAX1MYC4_9BACT|nr:lipase family protein [Flammeovirga yaeyamensis]MBB3696371.1 pimeloyl-ACP methyl ester carboxylesterase [Flammeovirga yaeyamensis]NMF35050.1 hypothetical protein [Flammeovirga yaeyamensis]QWG00126.1 hypothetical protein KMW28_10725 [Flammeovirga yaeyamensis]